MSERNSTAMCQVETIQNLFALIVVILLHWPFLMNHLPPQKETDEYNQDEGNGIAARLGLGRQHLSESSFYLQS